MLINRKNSEAIASDPLLFVGGMSRSGTTLLTAVLDAHPRLSIGTELIPAPMDAPAVLLDKLEKGMQLADANFAKAGRALAREGDYPVGVFFSRCCRAGLSLAEVRSVLEAVSSDLSHGVKSWDERLRLAWAMMRKRWLREQTDMFGFKLNSAAIAETAELFPEGRFVCIIRDPYDIVYSQLKNGFSDDPGKIVKSWNKVVTAYRDFAKEHPATCALVRYEDLVRSPHRTLERAFECLPVEFDRSVVSFHESDAEVLKAVEASRHPNLAQLRKGFFLESIGGGRKNLDAATQDLVRKGTRGVAETVGYQNAGFAIPLSVPVKAGPGDAFDFDATYRRKQRSTLDKKKKFPISQYEEILSPYLGSHEVLRLCDYVRIPDFEDRKALIIRHDIDHDIEFAVLIAEWEAKHNIKTTYCILHTAWYYGMLEGNAYKHSRLLIESVDRLLELGHEINFHNNLLALHLMEGIEPLAVLSNELEYWDRRGVPIVGTSMHGDRICRELNFRNSELFKECIEERFGGPRTLTHRPANGPERSVDVGLASMFDFGLEYEAYDVARDIYHSDSGGNIRTRDNTRGRRPFGREGKRGEVVGVLTHPIWWQRP